MKDVNTAHYLHSLDDLSANLKSAAEDESLIDSAESTLIRHTVQPFTESDDTRCCDNTICPPEDGRVNARNISRIVM
jgi:hypothetical protein